MIEQHVLRGLAASMPISFTWRSFSVILVALFCWHEADAQSAPSRWTDPNTGMHFVLVPKGCFRMGSDELRKAAPNQTWEWLEYAENLAADEAPVHEVCLDEFWLSVHEVRAQDWLRVMGERPPAGEGEMPAAGISWLQARGFAQRMTEIADGQGSFRLPTEAEWEYACRAGDTDDLRAGKGKPDLDDARKAAVPLTQSAWVGDNRRRLLTPAAVGRLAANRWGLHDMLGNVWEWVEDSYRADAYRQHALFNPLTTAQPTRINNRVIRGGSYRSETGQILCTNRGDYPEQSSLGQIGMRLVRVAPAIKKTPP